jgi:putative flippase GtrA
MFKWQSESSYFSRYALSGALNTVVGFAVIFLLMWLGLSPFIANIGGYLVGLILGFFVSKKFVFRSAGHFTSQGIRYLAAFLTCFGLNLFVLQIALGWLQLNQNVAQLLAAATYTILMYLLTRYLVFHDGMTHRHSNN